jgi:hypothetical protein
LVLTANLWKARLQNKKHLTKKPTAPTEAEQGSNKNGSHEIMTSKQGKTYYYYIWDFASPVLKHKKATHTSS